MTRMQKSHILFFFRNSFFKQPAKLHNECVACRDGGGKAAKARLGGGRGRSVRVRP